MAKKYYVHTIPQNNGDHEVHDEDCQWLPKPENRIYLGEHSTCVTAVAAARAHLRQVNGCKTCSTFCHTQ